MIKSLPFKIFTGFSSIYLLLLFLGYENLDLYLKPVLIPLLGLGVYYFEKFPSKKILLTALLFSWIGDVLLLFSYKAEIYFILGLASFLLSHLFYCVLFLKQNNIVNKLNTFKYTGGCVAIVLYLIGMFTVLLPVLGDLKIPVIIYAIVISAMLLFAFRGYLIWDKKGTHYVFAGAIIFVISDSILAVNKFYCPIEKSSFFIMITYLVAQYLIATGVLMLNTNSKSAA
jgi:uncharacterized membrane protein YhhN